MSVSGESTICGLEYWVVKALLQTYDHITELMTAFIGKNTTYKMKNMESKIIDMAKCKTCKKRLLAAEYAILVRYHHQTGKARALYKSTDGPAAQRADNPPISDGLGDVDWTIPEFRVQVNWQPWSSISQQVGYDLDLDPKQRSGNVASIISSWASVLNIMTSPASWVHGLRLLFASAIWLSCALRRRPWASSTEASNLSKTTAPAGLRISSSRHWHITKSKGIDGVYPRSNSNRLRSAD